VPLVACPPVLFTYALNRESVSLQSFMWTDIRQGDGSDRLPWRPFLIMLGVCCRDPGCGVIIS